MNAPPSVTIRSTTGAEGTAIPIHATAVDPEGAPVSGIHWMVVPAIGVDSGAACAVADPSALDTTVACTDDGLYAMTLTASDGDAIGSGAGTLTVTNAPPSVAIGTPAAGTLVLAGDPVAVQAAFTDPGTNDTHACAINWGDGSTTAGVLSESPAVCSGAHKYAAAARTENHYGDGRRR